MEQNNLVELLEQRFNLLFEGKRLLGICLDGYSHTVAFDNGDKDEKWEVLSYSGCAPEQKYDKRVATLFSGIGHNSYQGNPFIHYWFTREQR